MRLIDGFKFLGPWPKTLSVQHWVQEICLSTNNLSLDHLFIIQQICQMVMEKVHEPSKSAL